MIVDILPHGEHVVNIMSYGFMIELDHFRDDTHIGIQYFARQVREVELD